MRRSCNEDKKVSLKFFLSNVDNVLIRYDPCRKVISKVREAGSS